MSKNGKEIVTREYYEKLQAEYKQLIEVERPKNLEDIAAARSQGDLSENADYSAAREKQGEIEARIRDIEFQLDNLTVYDGKNNTNKVNPTSLVTIYDMDDECNYTYKLVGSVGSDPENFEISTESALGGALVGKKVGDIVEVVTGDGSSYNVKVIEIK